MRWRPAEVWERWISGVSVLELAVELDCPAWRIEELLRLRALDLGRRALDVANELILGEGGGDSAAGAGDQEPDGEREPAGREEVLAAGGDAEGAARGVSAARLDAGDGHAAGRGAGHRAAEDRAQA